MKHEFVAMLMIETDDPQLSEQALSVAEPDAKHMARVRRAILRRIPKDVTRVIAILPTQDAKALMALQELIHSEIPGATPHVRAPGYVPPTTE